MFEVLWRKNLSIVGDFGFGVDLVGKTLDLGV
jgi:hypothetical protein